MRCQDCGEDADEIVRVKVERKTLKLCEECAEIRVEEGEIAEGALSAMRDMMEYKG